MSEDMIRTVTSGNASAFHQFINTLKASDYSGHMGEVVTRWQTEYMHEELKFWESMWEREIASDSELAATEDPPRQEALQAARTLLRFFK
jgi:hypothetical protein